MQARLYSRDVRNRYPYEHVFLHFFDFKPPNELVLEVKVEELSTTKRPNSTAAAVEILRCRRRLEGIFRAI
jgi:hypothetical protein